MAIDYDYVILKVKSDLGDDVNNPKTEKKENIEDIMSSMRQTSISGRVSTFVVGARRVKEKNNQIMKDFYIENEP